MSMTQKIISRRQFVKLSSLTGGALVLAACSGGDKDGGDSGSVKVVAHTDEDKVMVGDVEQYALSTDKWEGEFGWVRFKMHEGVSNGNPVYFIRTDASTKAYADKEKLVFVPLLGVASGLDIANRMYLFGDNRPNVLAMVPGDTGFSSLFKMYNVTGDGDYNSEQEVQDAVAAGTLSMEETSVFCNFPIVKWEGGELPVDTELTKALAGGPLTEPINVSQKTVTFKLHKCYPGSRYIITDTSAAPMAPMMNITASDPTQELMDAGGTDEIYVFANGIPGPGAMGFQPAIFDNKAGEPAWSPFWNHFTVKWNDEKKAKLLKNSADVRALIDSGDLQLFNGVPDSHPNGFVVNCPAPILSPNDFKAA